MLAEMTAMPHDVPLREHSHLNLHQDNRDTVDSNAGPEKLCPGCKLSAVSEQGGLVVAFGQSFFHIDCFKCAKCGDQVTADTNLLLLSDGSPICANCSYSCNVCHLPILDEAIMAGDDSYHAHCFNCKVCKTRIDELVFAKTSQGIYCMNCHNERMIKIRKHAQKKAEREKGGNGSGSSRSREEARQHLYDSNGRSSPATEASAHSSSSTSGGQPKYSSLADRAPSSARSADHTAFSPRNPDRKIGESFVVSNPSTPASFASSATSPRPQHNGFASPTSSYFNHRPPSVTVAPPPDYDSAMLSTSSAATSHGFTSPRPNVFTPPPDKPSKTEHSVRQAAEKKNTLPLVTSNGDYPEDATRRKSSDDGTRPSQITPQKPDTPRSASGDGPAASQNLAVSTTSRRDKRRSINPGLALSSFNQLSGSNSSSPSQSPRSGSLRNQQSAAMLSQSPPLIDSHDVPRVSSPLREYFNSSVSSRATSHASSSNSYYSPSSSPVPPEDSDKPDSSRKSDPDQTLTRHPLTNMSAAKDDPEQQPARLSPGLAVNGNAIKPQRSFDSRRRRGSADSHRLSASSLTSHRSPSAGRSRPNSPAYRADVPHSVESGTDTDADADDSKSKSAEDESLEDENGDMPPAPPPKEAKDAPASASTVDGTKPPEQNLSPSDTDIDLSAYSQFDSGSDDMSESSPVERISHSTFIAPALPPIRFSMNADFSDLLNSVGGLPSLKSLDYLAKLTEEDTVEKETTVKDKLPPTPPPTAASFVSTFTPTSARVAVSPQLPKDPQEEEETKETKKLDDVKPPAAATSDVDTGARGDTVTAPDSRRPSLSLDTPPTPRGSSESQRPTPLESPTDTTRITLTAPDSLVTSTLRIDNSDLVYQRVQEVMADAQGRGIQQVKLDRGFLEAIAATMEARKAEFSELKRSFDGIKRTSKQYMDGLTVASTEYDRELKARRDAEAEVTRLRVLLSGQAARLTALSGDSRRQELRQQLSKELTDGLTVLEQNFSKMRAERDMMIAEIDELSAVHSSPADLPDATAAKLARSLAMRLDNIKAQYQRELVPLNQQRESLAREILELKAVRDVFLEETTVLNARNEELAQLSAQYARRIEQEPETTSSGAPDMVSEKKSQSFDRVRQPALTSSLSASTASSSTVVDDAGEAKYNKQRFEEAPTPAKKPKWSAWKSKEAVAAAAAAATVPENGGKGKAQFEHSFQQLSVLRFTRCDHCGDKLWGSQLRCSMCNMSIHVRCFNHVHPSCQMSLSIRDDAQAGPPPPSMFGRDLTEQVHADAQGGDRQVPVIVEKCIDAVETLALDYEGIYRKTGGSSQSKAITLLFERGDYGAFDLRDSDRFNDICSVTSVLKTYFRSLPVPLLTYDLHDNFMTAVAVRDPVVKSKTLLNLINQLPDEHYYTLRMLMLHLNHVRERSEKNLMNARNLGVVFGPTLMRSRDPGAEFSDMAGKALFVEWLVENAPFIFSQNVPS